MNDTIRHVPLNEYLSGKSNWPDRLLGWEEYQLRRKVDVARQEYDQDRYGSLGKCNGRALEQIKIEEFESLGSKLDEPHFYSVGEEVFVSKLRLVRHLWYAIILESVERFATGSICELGCGYGFNLGRFQSAGFKESYGGDFSKHAVALASELGLDVHHFNYYEEHDYKLIRPNSTVVTVHSLEQLPSAASFLENISKVRERVNLCIHIEPSFLKDRCTFFGKIRNRYNQLLDYNHDLIDILRAAKQVEILDFAADVFGLHPLNSSNIIVWRFRR